MIDIHTHILPEMDDGSRNVEESMTMLCMLSNQGVDTVVATPHFVIDINSPDEFLARRDEAARKLKEAFDEETIRPKIALGAEVQFYPDICSLDGIERFCIGETKYILIEMPFMHWTRYTYQVLNHLYMSRGVVPVIAHIERYLDFLNENEAFLKLREIGALIQINSSFLSDKFTRKKALNMVKKGIVSFVGSDCHNLTSRPPNLGEGCEVIYKKLGDVGFEELEYREDKLKKNLVVF